MRRLCLLVAAACLLWAILVAVTGGMAFNVGAVRVSSRSPVNPLVLAALAGIAAWALSPRGRRRAVLEEDLRTFAAPACAAAIAIIIVVTGLTLGALVVGGSDSYGYVSQADAWALGTVRFDEPLIREFAGRISRDALVPLGYLAVGEVGAVAPVYAPGLPMVMAVAQRVAGRDAVFWVVPLLGGVAILSTYVMGRRLAGKAVGVSAALLLGTSPSFLFQLTAAPMSDVAVTAWWALALALLLFDGRAAACLAGCAVSLAILTRPNLAPLALMPFVLLLATAVREQRPARALPRAMWFAAAVVPGCLAVAALNAVWYGSPLTSGYGRLSDVYAWQNLGPNLLRYPVWLFGSESPLILVAVAAPWLVTGVAARADARPVTWSWLCFIVVVLASYLFYQPFLDWWYVRFFLPAFPPLLVLTSAAMIAAASRLPSWSRVFAPVAVVIIVIVYRLDYARDHGSFAARVERKYAVAGDYVARRLPEKAAVLSMQHSGSVRYYSGRATVRSDVIPPSELDSTLAALTASGYRPYLLLEPFELAPFQQRYAGHSALAPLDWPPAAVLQASGIRIYDPADREALAGRPPVTEIVP